MRRAATRIVEIENQSTCGVDHLNCALTCCVGASPANEWCEMPAGQAESASRTRRVGRRARARPGAGRAPRQRPSSRATRAARPRSRAACTSPRARSRPRRSTAHHQALEGAGEDQELARRTRRSRHGERDDADRHQEGREGGSALRHTAEQRELIRRRPALDRARDQEERDRDEPVRDHLEHRTVVAEVRAGEEAERDQPRLRKRRVRNHPAHRR